MSQDYSDVGMEHSTSSSKVLQAISGSFEILLAIPILGALIVMGSSYVALIIMFILHVVTLAISVNNKDSVHGSILGIITSVLAWIPFVGWILHLITGILLLVSAASKRR